LWNMRKVMVIQVVIGALRVVTKDIQKNRV